VIVLSNNDGCAIARSEEAKALGIAMGAPAFKMRGLIEEQSVAVFSSNYTLYGDLSARVQEVYRQHVKDVEMYSIDESFLLLDDYGGGDLVGYADRIRRSVKRNTGLPICIGIAPTKTLAKAANRYAKKCRRELGVYLMATEEERKAMLTWIETGDIWGIGRQHGQWLTKNGIKNGWQLSQCNEAWIREKMGVVGVRLVRELNGTPCIELEHVPPPKQAICTSRSFGKLITDKEELHHAVATFTQRCAAKLRTQGSCAGFMQVFAYTNPHRGQDQQYHGHLDIELLQPTSYTGVLLRYARQAVDTIYRKDIKFMKAGVILMDLVPQTEVQGSLFGTQASGAKHQQAISALDGLNQQYGQDKVRFASSGYSRAWMLRNEHRSPRYTTHVEEARRVVM
jgi:DNA polymerase V